MKVRHDEGVATRIGPEPCGAIREGCVEASVGERIGQPLSRESLKVSGAEYPSAVGRLFKIEGSVMLRS